MTATTALAASLWLLGAGAVGLDAEVTATTRARRIDFGGGVVRETGELEAVPRLTIAGEPRPLRLSLSYAPRLLLPVDLSSESKELESWSTLRDRHEILHRVALSIEEQNGRGPDLRIDATGSYGDTDLLHAGDWEPQAVPVTTRIRLHTSRATVELSGSPSPRTRLSLRPGAFAQGGANATSRESLPFQRGVTLESLAAWKATRRDVLSGVFSGMLTRFTPRSDAAHFRAGVGWRHDLLPTTFSRLGAGAAGVWTDAPDPDVRGVGPWVEAALSFSSGTRLVAEASAHLEPSVDSTTGLVDQRIEGTAKASWSPTDAWLLLGRALVAGVGPFPSGVKLVTRDVETRLGLVEASVGRDLGTRTQLSVGGWGRWQDTSRGDLPSFHELGVLLQVIVQTHRPRPSLEGPPGAESSDHGS